MKKQADTKQPPTGTTRGRGRPVSGNKKVLNPAMLVYDVPEKLRLAFKSACALENKTMCKKLCELMDGYVKAVAR